MAIFLRTQVKFNLVNTCVLSCLRLYHSAQAYFQSTCSQVTALQYNHCLLLLDCRWLCKHSSMVGNCTLMIFITRGTGGGRLICNYTHTTWHCIHSTEKLHMLSLNHGRGGHSTFSYTSTHILITIVSLDYNCRQLMYQERKGPVLNCGLEFVNKWHVMNVLACIWLSYIKMLQGWCYLCSLV